MGARKKTNAGPKTSEIKTRYYNSGFGSATSAEADFSAPSVSHSIPYGSESGGRLIDFFKGILGKRKTDDDDFPVFEDSENYELPGQPDGSESEDDDTPKLLIHDDEFEPGYDDTPKQLIHDEFETSDTDTPKQISDDHETSSADTTDFAALHKTTMELSNELLNSDRFGHRSSWEMTTVKEQIRSLIHSLSFPIPSDYTNFMISLGKITDKYDYLIAACNAYVEHIREKGGGKRSFGKQRLALVTSLEKQYTKERAAFGPTARRIFSEKGNNPAAPGQYLDMNWSDVLGDVRAERINVSDPNVSTVGAGASMLYRREKEDGTVDFVKPEERLAKSDTAEAVTDQFLSEGGGSSAFGPLIDAMRKYYQDEIVPRYSSDAEPKPFEAILSSLCMKMYLEEAKGYYRSNGDIDTSTIESMGSFSDPALGLIIEERIVPSIPLCQQFIAMHTALSKKKVEMEAATGKAKIREGSAISSRNDATSRLAARYGISDVVASSNTVLLDHGNGNVTRANVMEGAAGQSMESLLTEKTKITADPSIKVDITYTPSSLMQMYTLEVFDLITGQVDRHKGNYFVTVNKVTDPGDPKHQIWYIESIKGIDNDLAFGNRSYNDMATGDTRNVPLFDDTQRALFTDETPLRQRVESDAWEQGQLTVHYLPETFYKRLVTYSPDVLMLDVVDTLSRDELLHLENRILAVSKLIQKYVTEGKIIIVPDGDEKALQDAYISVRSRIASGAITPQSPTSEKPQNGVIWDLIR